MEKISKYILTSGTAAFLLLSFAFVYAQNTRLDTLLNNAKSRSQEAKQQIQQVREQAQTQIKKIREAAKDKISQIKDKKKQETASKIADRLGRINQVWTDHFTNVLDRLDAVLQKVESRTEKASANGKDVSAVKFAIQNALDKISAARTAVASQAQKTYVINAAAVTGTTSTASRQSNLVAGLREQFKALRDQLFGDLKSLRDGPMKNAKTAVQDAIKELSKVPNVDQEPATNQ